ncbi:hypothetical protein EDB83DRAFT_1496339 [Lactarius deliciosus]|nr:hypothetical protein EDB83DRAFT_1496339 [Lactarius deliciosus]
MSSTPTRIRRCGDGEMMLKYCHRDADRRANGMFRWVFCQLKTLQHCFPPNLCQFLNELPKTLDETFTGKRILKGINKAQKDHARRLLHCLAVAVRPLRVEELAELLAFDFQASSFRGIPTLKEDWRWDDQEAAVLRLSTCSVDPTRSGDSRQMKTVTFPSFVLISSQRIRSWRRRAQGHCFGWTVEYAVRSIFETL